MLLFVCGSAFLFYVSECVAEANNSSLVPLSINYELIINSLSVSKPKMCYMPSHRLNSTACSITLIVSEFLNIVHANLPVIKI